VFDMYYQGQEIGAAAVGAVWPVACPQRLAPGPEPGRLAPTPISDTWLHAGPRVLAAPLAAVTVCRYAGDSGSGLDLRTQVGYRTTAFVIIGLLNTTGLDASELPFLNCQAGRVVDVVIMGDKVGETAELRILRDGCPAVVVGYEGSPSSTELLAQLDRWLGPPLLGTSAGP
jgi:hypothetical protein